MTGSRLAIYGALAANVAIAITKFTAAMFADSSALFSEGIHSIVDSGDGLLLLLGMRLSRRPPSERHPYGHGSETYFWSMVVAMSIFGMGGGVSLYEGIHHLLEPTVPTSLPLSLVVLGIAALFEGGSWLLSVRGFRKANGRRNWWTEIRASKDPTTFAVLLEDSAALIGILIAAAGISLAHLLGVSAFDAAASILIGLLLVAVGVILGRETWSLLIGESASAKLVSSVQAIARAQPGVVDARPPRTLHIGPDIVHVDLDVRVDDAHRVDEVVRKVEDAITRAHPSIRRVSFRFPS